MRGIVAKRLRKVSYGEGYKNKQFRQVNYTQKEDGSIRCNDNRERFLIVKKVHRNWPNKKNKLNVILNKLKTIGV